MLGQVKVFSNRASIAHRHPRECFCALAASGNFENAEAAAQVLSAEIRAPPSEQRVATTYVIEDDLSEPDGVGRLHLPSHQKIGPL